MQMSVNMYYNVLQKSWKTKLKITSTVQFFYHIVKYYAYRDILQKGKELLLIQCDTGDENSGLVECARHCVQRELQKQNNKLELCVVFLVHLSRVSKSCFSGFQVNTDWYIENVLIIE